MVASIRPNSLRRYRCAFFRQHGKIRKNYHVDIGQFRVAALWQFGGYDLNNAATGAYQLQLGGDITNLAGGTLSLDAIGSYVQNAVSIGLAGNTLPAVLPQVLTATLSNDSSVMLVGKYTNGPLKLFAGYEFIQFCAPQQSVCAPYRFYKYRGRLRLRRLHRGQQYQYQQHGFQRRRQVTPFILDWSEIRCHRQSGSDRRLLPLYAAHLWCIRQLHQPLGVLKLPWDPGRRFLCRRLAVCEEI
jgi:hypothetical protein